jgi:hypothetical protein
MNRQRFVSRDFNREGDQRAQQLGLALAAECDPDFLEAFLHHKAAMDEFGGQLYIAAARVKVDADAMPVDHSEAGHYITYGYIFHFGHKAQLKGALEEPDVKWGGAQAPELEVDVTDEDEGEELVPVEETVLGEEEAVTSG